MLRWVVPLLLVGSLAPAAGCPPPSDPVTTDVHAVGCANLQLTITADNIEIVIVGATGTIHVASDRTGTTLRLSDSNVTGNLTFTGPNATADVRRSTVTGVDVLSCFGARNQTIIVTDATLAGTVVASVLSSGTTTSVEGVSIIIDNSTITATRYAASVVGARVTDISVTVSGCELTLQASGDHVGVAALASDSVTNATVNVTSTSIALTGGHSFVGVLGSASAKEVTWTGVTLRAALVNLTSAAKDYVGILGVGSYGRVSWTNVLVAVTFTNVTSTVGNYVGIVGAASNSGVAGVNVTVTANLLRVTVAALDYVGILGAGGGNEPTVWSNVTVAAVRTIGGRSPSGHFRRRQQQRRDVVQRLGHKHAW